MNDVLQGGIFILSMAVLVCGTAEVRDRVCAAKYSDPDLRMALAWWAAYYDVAGRREEALLENRSALSRYLMTERMSSYKRMLDDGAVTDSLRRRKILRRNGTIMERDYQAAGRIVFETARGMAS